MQAVLIAMTILGCNDAVTQCNYVATVEKHWETVALCDADSEKQLRRYGNVSYPTVIAVCEPPKSPLPPENPVVADVPAQQPEPQAPEQQSRFAAFADRISHEVRSYLPTPKSIQATLEKPVHYVSASYSWAVKKIEN